MMNFAEMTPEQRAAYVEKVAVLNDQLRANINSPAPNIVVMTQGILAMVDSNPIIAVARQMELMFKRTLRWQLWTRAGELRLVPSSHRAIIKLVSQVRAIGRSLNQAVKAMNAANRPQSPLEIQRIAAEVIAMEDRISQLVNDAAAGLTEILSGEVYYWTGRERKLPSIIGTAR